MNLITAAEAARQLNCHPRTVTRAALTAGITRITHTWLFTPADLRVLAKVIAEKPGNPLMGKQQPAHYGNHKKGKK